MAAASPTARAMEGVSVRADSTAALASVAEAFMVGEDSTEVAADSTEAVSMAVGGGGHH